MTPLKFLLRLPTRVQVPMSWPPSPRVLYSSVIAVLVTIAIYSSSSHVEPGMGRIQLGMGSRPPSTSLPALSMAAAGNSTLGFDSIYMINLPSRYDRLDAHTLQAYLSGIDFVEYPGVESDQIHDVGMPPTHNPGIDEKAKACWRAHANIWSLMLRKSLPAVLVIEGDAVWDTNVRKIMSNLNKHFIRFLRQIRSTPVPNSSWKARDSDENPTLDYSSNDPWQSRHWDLLSIGYCNEEEQNKDINLIFPDPYVLAGFNYYGRTLSKERVIRKSGGPICTAGYAISQTGAAKLLLRSAMDLDLPVDVIIKEMVVEGHLMAYSVLPVIIAQSAYAEGIGMDLRGTNSDINGHGKPIDENTEMKGRADVWKSGTVWKVKGPDYPALKDMALEGAWKQIVGSSKRSP